METWEDRFWAKVRDDGDCWIWTAHVNPQGYGEFGRRGAGCRKGKSTRAHRIAYELVVGQIPPGLVLDHLCRNRACVNPAHLEVVTVRENILRGSGFAALNARKTHCPRGHELTPDNVYRRGRRRVCRTCEIRRNTIGGGRVV